MEKYTVDYWKNKGINVFDNIPKGWVICRYTMTSPRGYVWICNNKSFFTREREHALLKEGEINECIRNKYN